MMLPKGTLEHAKRIRRSLVLGRQRTNRHRSPDEHEPLNLAGTCGLASVLLCLAIGDTELRFLRGTYGHAWNVFPNGKTETIVDLTATQFTEDLITTEGIYLGTHPKPYHRVGCWGDTKFKQGHEMIQYIINDEWYDAPRPGFTPGEFRRWRAACATLTTPATNRSSVPTVRRATKG
jgi:hypothetical protein